MEKNCKYQSPCKDCEKRYLGCHDHCEEYKKFKEDWDACRTTIRKERKLNNDYNGLKYRQNRHYGQGV